MLQQVTAEVQLRLVVKLTALLVLMERVWWISHSLITSSSALDIWRSTFHTPVVEDARFVKQYSQPYFQVVSCNSSSRVFFNHYRTLLWWCYLLSYRGKRSIDYPAQGKPYNILPPLERRDLRDVSVDGSPSVYGRTCLPKLRSKTWGPRETCL